MKYILINAICLANNAHLVKRISQSVCNICNNNAWEKPRLDFDCSVVFCRRVTSYIQFLYLLKA